MDFEEMYLLCVFTVHPVTKQNAERVTAAVSNNITIQILLYGDTDISLHKKVHVDENVNV